MPTLDWLNRDAAFRITRQLPTRVLRPHRAAPAAVGADSSGNLLIQGDNLEALAALLPFYRGRVKCIFIDPPYNTKSAFEHYDDNLEHSQWLTMMLPRLQLLRELLSEDGSIWVTIDDNEGHYLKVMMDEVFGRQHFMATIAWQSRYSRSSDTAISVSHNFIHCYATDASRWKLIRNRLPRSAAQEKQFSNSDDDSRGPWRAVPWDAPNIRANLSYPILAPTGRVRLPPPGRCWSRTEVQWLELVASGRAYFGKNGDGAPSFKQYLDDAPPIVPNTWWSHDEAGHTDESKKEAQTLFGNDSLFGTPKPERLIHRIIHIASNADDLVLDSFLGSGTTAAVAHKMGRRWIGIEMGEHALTHCLPRLRKVVDGEQGGISEAVGWQGGGGFACLQLGAPLFDADGEIHPEVRFADLAAFLWLRETGSALQAQPVAGPWLGTHQGTCYHLLFNGVLGDRRPAGGNVLTSAVLALLLAEQPHVGLRVVYGEACLLGPARLAAAGVSFKQLPHAVPR